MLKLDRIPPKDSPLWPVLALQTVFVGSGITFLGFNRSPAQVALVLCVAVLTDCVLHYLLRRKTLLVPVSALITGLGLSILTNYPYGLWLAAVPPFFAIASKYVFTVNGRHIYNPGLFGVMAALTLSGGMITPSPAYQWGGSGVTAFFIATAAIMLFVLKIRRSVLIVSFVGLYTVQLALRAWVMQHHLPPETLFLGAFSSPAFYLFTFFMITDPPTSPDTRRGQFFMAFFIVSVDLLLHKFQTFSTLFYAAFAYFTVRGAWLLVREWRTPWREALRDKARAVLLSGCLVLAGWGAYRLNHQYAGAEQTEFRFEEIAAEHSGIGGMQGDIWARTDPRMQHVAKWLLSVGDAVAVADVDNDGLPDVFLTQPLKSETDRAQLFINKGNFRFQKFPLPLLDANRRQPESHGLAAAATFFDMDNDGDQDLLIGIGFGRGRLLKNELAENGTLAFTDISTQAGLDAYQISTATNVVDMNQDGRLDVLVGNVMHRELPGYDKPMPFTIFRLPEAEYAGDRRMFDVMHRSWHDANNADENLFYLNQGGGRFKQIPAEKIGFGGNKRWTMAIGTGDLNDDGWPDLYVANDFGPDEFYLNRSGTRFEQFKGGFVGSVGRDTYKGMNVTFGDLDDNGRPDIHVSNVHHKLQAEGSLLWMNRSQSGEFSPDFLKNEAAARNALNERRFGWGAAFGDLDRDGRLDMLQANGMADDAYDKREAVCPDYWYWNAQIALTNPDVHGFADRWADVRGRCVFGNEANRIYLNKGSYFIDVADQAGWTVKGTSRGIALADFDNDGDLDSIVTHMTARPSLYRNHSRPANWIGVKLVGNGQNCNRDAVGSKITLDPAHSPTAAAQYREIYANNGLAAQGDRRIIFGLGHTPHQTARLHIRWCGRGSTQTVELAAGRYHEIRQP